MYHAAERHYQTRTSEFSILAFHSRNDCFSFPLYIINNTPLLNAKLGIVSFNVRVLLPAQLGP